MDRGAHATALTALKTALSGAYLVRALVVAAIVGTVLTMINQGDVIMHGAPINWVKCALTYLVPFCVTTYGAASALAASSLANRAEMTETVESSNLQDGA